MSLKVEDDRLTLQSSNTPLDTILAGIRDQAQIEIKSLTSTDEEVTVDFKRVPLREGLVLLMKNYSYALEFSDPGEENSRVTSLFILSKTGSKQGSIVWQKNDELKSSRQSNVLTGNQSHHQLFPEHLKDSPENTNPMKSPAAIDPLVGLELQEKGMYPVGKLHRQFFPDR